MNAQLIRHSSSLCVVLDEATSSLSEEDESYFYSLLQEMGITFLSIGHRSTIKKVLYKMIYWRGEFYVGDFCIETPIANINSLPINHLVQYMYSHLYVELCFIYCSIINWFLHSLAKGSGLLVWWNKFGSEKLSIYSIYYT